MLRVAAPKVSAALHVVFLTLCASFYLPYPQSLDTERHTHTSRNSE